MKKLSITLALTGLLLSNAAIAKTVVFNESFTDGTRTNGPDAQDANWWTSTNKDAVEITKGSLGLVSGGSGRGIRATFNPQALPAGKSITATYTFTVPQTIGSNKESSFRVGLYNKSGRQGLDRDISSSSKKPSPLFNGLHGYMIDYDVNLNNASKANIDIRKKSAPTGRLLGTTKGYKHLGGGGNPYTFAPGQTYIGSISLKNVPTGVQVTGTLRNSSRQVLSTFTAVDRGMTTNNIGMLALHVNSKTFGSSKKVNTPDNGLDFRNVKVEVTP